ncbi:carbohydrate kinase family protein [Cesiribacter sp. SM1]|uniref:carbohydrate kinase family protein n=1 Tax=Cesiribacter sp. SM1 TaxID=2861196 RepID=UPI001CD1A381|nr:sugar kinase [Cesiribacter sp. SM1]
MDKIHDVVVIGELNVDLILNQIDQFPEVGKEVLAGNMNLTLGSSSAIFASNLSTLGVRTTFIGKVGNDNFGDLVIASLKSRGVDTGNILLNDDHQTGATIVLNFGEDRAMVTHPGAMEHLRLEDVQETVLTSARHLHLSSVFLQAGLTRQLVPLFQKAKSLGLTTSIDPQWDPAERWDIDLKALLPHVDVFLPNTAELMALTKTSNLEHGIESLKRYANILVVKGGREGAWAWRKGELVHQPAFLNEQVVDSIGAGDSFDAGFISKYIQGKSLQECLEFGALSGAINTTRPGGTTAFENLDLVKSIAESTFNYTF